MENDLDKRIRKEELRLLKVYADIDPNRKKIILGLIRRAAFMRISLDDLEKDLCANGLTEEFSQGDQTPYLRERPAARIYSGMNSGYQKIIKQLTDLLPKEEAKPKGGDEFESFGSD